MGYWLLIIVTLVIGFGTQAYIRSSYRKYSHIAVETGLTGMQTARRMLDSNGLTDVEVIRVNGNLTDHYDPRTRVVSLSEDVYDGRSVASTAIACHECGHAVQHARGYVPLKIRSALIPIANFGSNIWLVLLMIGLFLNIMQLFWLGIIFYAFAILFQIVTLPVEFNASRRGLGFIEGSGGTSAAMVSGRELDGARTVLTAAALTYVAAALTSVIQLLYFLGMARD